MENVLLVVHIITCIALIGVVLLQRSEGGALGGIGGGGGGGLMSGRGAASALTRTTMILAGVFIATSLILTTIATRSNQADATIGGEIERTDEGSLDLPALPLDSEADLDSGLEATSDLDAPAEIIEDIAEDAPEDLSEAVDIEPEPQQ